MFLVYQQVQTMHKTVQLATLHTENLAHLSQIYACLPAVWMKDENKMQLLSKLIVSFQKFEMDLNNYKLIANYKKFNC